MSAAEALPVVELPYYARRNDHGLYTWAGVRMPSVTTIIGLFSGDYLAPWAAKLSAQECAEIIEKRAEGFLSDKEAEEKILDWPSRMTRHIRERDHAGRRGSLVHHSIYEWSLGVRNMISDPHDYLLHWIDKLALVDPYRAEADHGSYAELLAKESRHYVANALAWIEKEKPEFEAIGQEAVTVNETHGYAGTMDALVKLRGQRLVLDFKTSKSRQDRKWQLQLEAYRHAEFIGLVASGEKFDMGETDGSAVLWIKPLDACELLPYSPREDYFEAFLALRQAYGVLHDLPKPNCKPRSAPKPKRDRYDGGF